MSKFHINKHGVPAPCKAQKGNCPLGGDSGDENHFDSKEEAQEFADKKNAEQHGILPEVGSEQSSEASKRFESQLEEGDIKSVEENMVYHKAEDVEGAYNSIQDLRESGISFESIEKEKSDIDFQIFEAGQDIEKDIYENGKLGEVVKVAEGRITATEARIAKGKEKVDEVNSGDCPKCGEGKMVERKGKYGAFIACNNYPKCKHTHKKASEDKSLQDDLERAKYNRQIGIQEIQAEAKKLQATDPKSIELKQKLEDVDKSSKYNVAKYVDKYENPEQDPMYPGRNKSEKTPVEQYYEERKAADDKIEKQIGKNKIALNSGQMTYGTNNKIEADLRVDEDGKVDNLYLESEATKGEVNKVISISDDGGLKLDNDEHVRMYHVTNWNMGRGRQETPPQKYKLYTTESEGKKYDGNTNVAMANIDSSD